MASKFYQSEPITVIDIIRKNQLQKKQFDIQDAYKLIYQSVFGLEHLLNDQEMARHWLEQELDSIEGESNEPLIEQISDSGEVVRLNLRPYKQLKGTATQLFQAMIFSSQQIHGTRERFLSLWRQFQQAVAAGLLDFDQEALLHFDRFMSAKDYPPIHHSAGYREANRPAYRVLSQKAAATLVKALLKGDRGNA